MIFLSLRQREREREKERDGKASVPASFCSSLVIATSTFSSSHTRKKNSVSFSTAATEIQSLLIEHRISVEVLSSIGRRHDFKEVRTQRRPLSLVRPPIIKINRHTSCSLVSEPLCARKESKISVRFRWSWAHEQESNFSRLQREGGRRKWPQLFAARARASILLTNTSLHSLFLSRSLQTRLDTARHRQRNDIEPFQQQ